MYRDITTRTSPNVTPQSTLTGPRLGDPEVTQMICPVLVLGKVAETGLFDLLPVLCSTLRRVAVLLLLGHVRAADPVLVLGLYLQTLQRVAFHLPRDVPRSSIFSNPLFARYSFPQQRQRQEHGGRVSFVREK